jgi:cytochrome c oxidase subunit 1
MNNDQTIHVHEGAVGTHDVHHHDGNGHHHHKQSFVTKYIFSQDHKTIAKQFLITGIMWAIIGALFSVLFRLQLGFPEQTFPFLETLFGKWAKGGKIDPEFYYALITMHGTILVFFVLTAGLSGTFANLFIPLQVGASDMASPFLNMLSYWFFFMASVIMMSSLFVETGPASGGWTSYAPLKCLARCIIRFQNRYGSLAGEHGPVRCVISLLGGLNYISTILNMRTKGMTMTRMPLTIWGLFFTAILGVLSFPVLLSGFILLLLDRHLGTSFYLSDIYVAGKILPNEGGSAILYQHLFWFLGHPEVYIIILPAMGMVSEIMSVNSRKPIFGYMAMVGSLFAIAILAFLVWAHHMFVTGLNPFLGSVFVLLTLADRDPVGHQSVQLDHHYLAGEYPVHPGHVVLNRFCKLVHFGWTDRYLAG